MVSQPPEHCPACGTALDPVDPPKAFDCPACEERIFHDPAPNARVAVLDGDAVLLVEVDDAHRVGDPVDPPDSEWMLPGGHLEFGESPAEAAARELREETGLDADPGALVLFEAVARQVVAGAHATVLLYAADRESVAGTPTAATDAADARFWTPADLSASDRQYRTLYEEPERYSRFEGLVERVQAALEDR